MSAYMVAQIDVFDPEPIGHPVRQLGEPPRDDDRLRPQRLDCVNGHIRAPLEGEAPRYLHDPVDACARDELNPPDHAGRIVYPTVHGLGCECLKLSAYSQLLAYCWEQLAVHQSSFKIKRYYHCCLHQKTSRAVFWWRLLRGATGHGGYTRYVRCFHVFHLDSLDAFSWNINRVVGFMSRTEQGVLYRVDLPAGLGET